MQAWPLTGRAEEPNLIADVLGDDRLHTGVAIAGRARVGKAGLAREVAASPAQSIPLGSFPHWTGQLDTRPLHRVRGVKRALTSSPNRTPVLMDVDDPQLLDNLSAFVLHQLVLTALSRRRPRAPTRPSAAVAAPVRRPARIGPSWPCQCAVPPAHVVVHARQHIVPAPVGRLGAGLRRAECQRRRLAMGRPVGRLILTRRRKGFVHRGGPTPVLDVIDLSGVADRLELQRPASLADPETTEEAERRGLITVLQTPLTGLSCGEAHEEVAAAADRSGLPR
jgi:hypothetical protein